jgi:hypothetical protein
MSKSITKIIGFTFSILVILALAWFMMNLYPNVYPGSENIHVNRPFAGDSYEESLGYKKHCKDISWRIDAQLKDGLRSTLRQYYAKKWNKEPRPMGLQINPTDFSEWDSYIIFNWEGTRYSILIHKDVYYQQIDVKPFSYSVATNIDLCSVNK